MANSRTETETQCQQPSNNVVGNPIGDPTQREARSLSPSATSNHVPNVQNVATKQQGSNKTTTNATEASQQKPPVQPVLQNTELITTQDCTNTAKDTQAYLVEESA